MTSLAVPNSSMLSRKPGWSIMYIYVVIWFSCMAETGIEKFT